MDNNMNDDGEEARLNFGRMLGVVKKPSMPLKPVKMTTLTLRPDSMPGIMLNQHNLDKALKHIKDHIWDGEDTWITISDGIDLLIYVDEDTGEHVAQLYPVFNGQTDQSYWLEISRRAP